MAFNDAFINTFDTLGWNGHIFLTLLILYKHIELHDIIRSVPWYAHCARFV